MPSAADETDQIMPSIYHRSIYLMNYLMQVLTSLWVQYYKRSNTIKLSNHSRNSSHLCGETRADRLQFKQKCGPVSAEYSSMVSQLQGTSRRVGLRVS